jgi:predicted nucleotidyltransferase
MFNYGQYWQADELSDIDLLVKLEPGDVLFKLPAHKLVLSHSPFFKAKVSTQVVC